MLSLLLPDTVLYKVVPPVVHGAEDDDGEDEDGGDHHRDSYGEKVELGLADLSLDALKGVDDAEIRDLARHGNYSRE